jgi:hypothetical protein
MSKDWLKVRIRDSVDHTDRLMTRLTVHHAVVIKHGMVVLGADTLKINVKTIKPYVKASVVSEKSGQQAETTPFREAQGCKHVLNSRLQAHRFQLL